MLAGGLLYATFIIADGPGRLAIQNFCLICFCIAGIGALYSMHSFIALVAQTGVAAVALWLLIEDNRAPA